MATPKRKMARARTRNRRAQWMKKSNLPNIVFDKETGTWRIAHTVNPETGRYAAAK